MNNRLDNRYQADIKRIYKPVTEEEEKVLVEKAQKGDVSAKTALLNSQYNQIISIAKGFVTEDSSLSELIGEGMLGFYEGLDRFDPTRGVRLITYCRGWILAYISKYAHENNMIRHPANIQHLINTVDKAKKSILLGEKVDKDTLTMVEEFEKSYPLRYSVKSFHDPINNAKNDPNQTFEDQLGEEDSMLATIENKVGVKKVMSLLDDSEKEIFALFFGLDGNDRHTVEEIATITGASYRSGKTTKQNVSTIKNKAIARLHKRFKVKAELVED